MNLIKELLNEINSSIKGKHDLISQINALDYFKIKKVNTNKSLIFFDGGSAELIKSPSLSVFYNRVYYAIYKNKSRP